MSTRTQVPARSSAVYLLVAIALYVIFGSDGKNEDFKPQDEFKLEPWIRSTIGGLDLSFNKAVLYLLITCVLTIGTMVYIARRMEEKPNRMQTVIEGAYDLTYNQIAREQHVVGGRCQVVPASSPRCSSSSGSRTCSATSRCR